MFICLVRVLLCIGLQELPACGEKVQMGAFKVSNGQHNIVLHCKSIVTAARTSQLLLPLKIKAAYNIQTKHSARTIISSPLSILMVK